MVVVVDGFVVLVVAIVVVCGLVGVDDAFDDDGDVVGCIDVVAFCSVGIDVVVGWSVTFDDVGGKLKGVDVVGCGVANGTGVIDVSIDVGFNSIDTDIVVDVFSPVISVVGVSAVDDSDAASVDVNNDADGGAGNSDVVIDISVEFVETTTIFANNKKAVVVIVEVLKNIFCFFSYKNKVCYHD